MRCTQFRLYKASALILLAFISAPSISHAATPVVNAPSQHAFCLQQQAQFRNRVAIEAQQLQRLTPGTPQFNNLQVGIQMQLKQLQFWKCP